MRLKNWIVPFLVGAAFMMTADIFAQDAGLYSSEELGRRSLPGEDAIAAQLIQERRNLDARERSISAKEDAMRASEAELRDAVAKNEKLRDEIAALLDTIDQAHAEEVARQIKVYEKMRGSQAAPILAEMDDDFVVPILRGMRPDKAAKVLAAMPAKVAAGLSEQLNADPLDELAQ